MDIERRVLELEKWKQEIEIHLAVSVEQKSYMERRFNELDSLIKSFKEAADADRKEVRGWIYKLVGVIVLSTVGAVMTFIFRGGLIQ